MVNCAILTKDECSNVLVQGLCKGHIWFKSSVESRQTRTTKILQITWWKLYEKENEKGVFIIHDVVAVNKKMVTKLSQTQYFSYYARKYSFGSKSNLSNVQAIEIGVAKFSVVNISK